MNDLVEYMKTRTQRDLAREIGISESYLSLMLSGKRKIPPPVAMRIQAATGGKVLAAQLVSWE